MQKLDMKRLRLDLTECIGCDGLSEKHLTLKDEELIEQFAYVYGVDELKHYELSDK